MTSSSPTSEMRQNWPVIIAASLGMGLGVTSLLFYSIGVVSKPMQTQMGWSRGDIQGMFIFLTFGVLLGSPCIGRLIDTVGLRRTGLWTTAGFAVGVMLMGLLSKTLPIFYALTFLTALVGSGTSSVLWSRVMFGRFTLQPGLALGFAQAGTGIAGMILPVFANTLLEAYGWRMTFVGLALLSGLLTLPAVLLLLKDAVPAPASDVTIAGPQSGMTPREALHSYRFWVLSGGFFFVLMGTAGLIPNLVPLLTDHGYTSARAAQIAGLQAAALVIGRLAVGALLDRIWAPALAAICFIIPCIACLILSYAADNTTLTTIAVLIIGFAGGAEFDLLPYLARRYFGMRNFGTIYGMIYAVFVSANAISPPMFGYVYDMTGSYRPMLNTVAVFFVIGGLMLLTLGRYPKDL